MVRATDARNAESNCLGFWFVWMLVLLLVAMIVPGFSYLWLVPCALVALTMLVGFKFSSTAFTVFVTLVGMVTMAILWLPTLWLLYEAIGFITLVPYFVVMTILGIVVAPIAVGVGSSTLTLRVASISIGLAVVLSVGAGLLPSVTNERPGRINIVFHQDESEKTARWLVQPMFTKIPASILAERTFGPPDRPFDWSMPWETSRASVASFDPSLSGPTLQLLAVTEEDFGKVHRIRLRSRPGATLLGMRAPRAIKLLAAVVEGERHAVTRALHIDGDTVYRFAAWPSDGVELELTFPEESGALEVLLFDQTPGLPNTAASIRQARGEMYIESQFGDSTIVSRRLTLLSATVTSQHEQQTDTVGPE